ncbi:putative leucine-rich repeat-containing protein DDB_G0290503 [Neodiprion pinetum]|uniref:putative leucine-rich repeat-containing protein DDB_G0290503 n=1 Tax=Neodiprion pinetum TaxID=441929 RepID=UPI001EE0206E|nr:uncharacterized protein LOC124222303 [Neodiprion pinetum]
MSENEKTNDGVQRKSKKYNYLLIMFNKRGPKTGQKVYDFVPANWVYVSKQTGKLVVKFMPPPYLDETSDLLHHLVRTLSDPIDDWPEYNVQLKGGAESYEDAETRLQVLDAKDYAFTTDADEAPEAKASEIVRQLKQTKLKVSAETEAALQVPELNSDKEEDSSAAGPINSTHRQLSKPKRSRSTLLSNEGTSSVSKGHDQNGNFDRQHLKKDKTDGTTSGSKALDQNKNLKVKDLNQKKSNGVGEKSTIINIDSQASTSQRSRVNPIDENSNLSEESLPESAFCRYYSRDSRLSVGNIYTDSESEGHIDINRVLQLDSVKENSLQLSGRYYCPKTLPGKDSVSSHKKPSKSKSEKTGQKSFKLRDDPKSKPERPEDNPQQSDPKLKANKAKNKSNFADFNKKSNKTGEHKSKDDFTSDSELLWQIYEDLQNVKLDVAEIRANQRKEEEIRLKVEVEQEIQENFISKHNLELPYTEKEAFDEFNSKLLSNKDFREAFMKSLVKLFDRDLIASKTLNNILKKYVSRKLAMRHTAMKRMPGKFLMKDTAFFDCLLGVFASTHRDKGGKFISESTFSSVLGNVLGNAKDWDGKRNRKNRESVSDEVGSDQASSGVDEIRN